jgi:hypothetical protein
MVELKTKLNDASVVKFLNTINDEANRNDCFVIMELMQKITKSEPKMWGDSIVGFGKYHYKYESGREGDWFLTGFSPRKQNLTIYIMTGFDQFEGLMSKLGKYKASKSCLYIKSLKDIDQKILKELITLSVKRIKNKKL